MAFSWVLAFLTAVSANAVGPAINAVLRSGSIDYGCVSAEDIFHGGLAAGAVVVSFSEVDAGVGWGLFMFRLVFPIFHSFVQDAAGGENVN